MYGWVNLTLLICVSWVLSSCSSQGSSGSEICTRQAIGDGTGSDTITVSLTIPSARIDGAEIRNAGISADTHDCDYPLNMFLSEDTIDRLISDSKKLKLRNASHDTALAQVELSIWKFNDGSKEARFFVTRAGELAEPEAPTEQEKSRFKRSR